MARESIPIADALVTEISAQLARWPGQTVLGQAAPWTIEREIRKARKGVDPREPRRREARGDHHLCCRPGFALGLTCSQGMDATPGGQCGADSGRVTPFVAGLVTCD
jgi:hypothetical protein